VQFAKQWDNKSRCRHQISQRSPQERVTSVYGRCGPDAETPSNAHLTSFSGKSWRNAEATDDSAAVGGWSGAVAIVWGGED